MSAESRRLALVVREGSKVVRVLDTPRGLVERILLHEGESLTVKQAAALLGDRSKTLVLQLIRAKALEVENHGSASRPCFTIPKGAMLRYALARDAGAVREQHLVALIGLLPWFGEAELDILQTALAQRRDALRRLPSIEEWVTDAKRQQAELSLS